MTDKELDNKIVEVIERGENRAGLIEAAIFWPNQTPTTMRAVDKSLQRLRRAKRIVWDASSRRWRKP